MKPLPLHLLLISLALFLVACGSPADFSAIQATTEAETALTGRYGAEVGSAIENFESKWYSREDHLGPKVQREIATDKFLHWFGHTFNSTAPFGEPDGSVTKSAVVACIRVLEYSPERFKAIAGVIEQVDKVTSEGEFKESLPYHKFCKVYVFLREDDAWKIAALFDITNQDFVPREWEHASPDLKSIIGDLPNHDCDFMP